MALTRLLPDEELLRSSWDKGKEEVRWERSDAVSLNVVLAPSRDRTVISFEEKLVDSKDPLKPRLSVFEAVDGSKAGPPPTHPAPAYPTTLTGHHQNSAILHLKERPHLPTLPLRPRRCIKTSSPPTSSPTESGPTFTFRCGDATPPPRQHLQTWQQFAIAALCCPLARAVPPTTWSSPVLFHPPGPG